MGISRESVKSHISYTYTSTEVTYISIHSNSKIQLFESPGRCRGGRGREAAAPVRFKHSNTHSKNTIGQTIRHQSLVQLRFRHAIMPFKASNAQRSNISDIFSTYPFNFPKIIRFKLSNFRTDLDVGGEVGEDGAVVETQLRHDGLFKHSNIWKSKVWMSSKSRMVGRSIYRSTWMDIYGICLLYIHDTYTHPRVMRWFNWLSPYVWIFESLNPCISCIAGPFSVFQKPFDNENHAYLLTSSLLGTPAAMRSFSSLIKWSNSGMNSINPSGSRITP